MKFPGGCRSLNIKSHHFLDSGSFSSSDESGLCIKSSSGERNMLSLGIALEEALEEGDPNGDGEGGSKHVGEGL